MKRIGIGLLHAGFLGGLLAGAAAAQSTSRVSLDSAGRQVDGGGSGSASISADGRYVAFESSATDLVPGDTNGNIDVFVHDRQTGTTERVSVDSSGAQVQRDSWEARISADGRYVAFTNFATTLVPGDTNDASDVFVHDRLTGATERVSVATTGVQGNDASFRPSISADGRYVAFVSSASDLVVLDTNGTLDVFVHDRQTGRTKRVSVDSAGNEGDGFTGSYFSSISGDGRYVAFLSFATNLVPGDTNDDWDIFVHDRATSMTERVSVGPGGVQANGLSDGIPSISADGRFVAFVSYATNLVAGDVEGVKDIFVRDRLNGTTERVSVDSSGTGENGDCGFDPSISPDGRFVSFSSYADNLVAGDTNVTRDIFLHDRQAGTTERVSVSSTGVQGELGSDHPVVSFDGRYVAFESYATDLVPGDTNIWSDVFVRDRAYAPSASLCDPGVGGVLACPCGNPPSGAGRGCDNSAATGGASLSASGVAYLTQDTLVFTTAGEKPTATSVLLQGTAVNAGGATYGQGVRCVGGILKRLYTKTASGGSVTAPDFGAGDPSVTTRSAAKGNVIGAGQSRWYLVFYRDPIVLGGCPSTSTFDATQTQRVDWIP